MTLCLIIHLNALFLAFICIPSLITVHGLGAYFSVQNFFSCFKNSGINFVDYDYPSCHCQTIRTSWECECMWLDLLIALESRFCDIWANNLNGMLQASGWDHCSIWAWLFSPKKTHRGRRVARALMTSGYSPRVLRIPTAKFLGDWSQVLKSRAGLIHSGYPFILLSYQPDLGVRVRIFVLLFLFWVLNIKIQWDNPWLVCLNGLVSSCTNRKVTGSIPCRHTCLGCRPGPWLGGMCKKQPIAVSHIDVSAFSLHSSSLKINK